MASGFSRIIDSLKIIGRMMDFRTYLASPKVSLGVVDVRDVARAHVGRCSFLDEILLVEKMSKSVTVFRGTNETRE